MYLLQLTRGLCAQIDDDDVERVLAQGRWQAALGYNTWYGATSFKIPGTRKNRKLLLHRFIMNCVDGDGTRIDHINGDGLDCRKTNLRRTTASLNAFNREHKLASNTSGHEGVYWNKQKQIWVGEIIWQGKKIYCGASHDKNQIAETREQMKNALLEGLPMEAVLGFRKLSRKPPTQKGV